MGIPILGEIERWITEHGSAAVLKEHLVFLQARLGALREEIAKREKENADLKARIADLEKKPAPRVIPEDLLEHRGAYFKRRAGGGYHDAVYCCRCFQSTSPFPRGEQFICGCGWFSSFTEDELPAILRSLPPA